jgi:hypothetical protein
MFVDGFAEKLTNVVKDDFIKFAIIRNDYYLNDFERMLFSVLFVEIKNELDAINYHSNCDKNISFKYI